MGGRCFAVRPVAEEIPSAVFTDIDEKYVCEHSCGTQPLTGTCTELHPPAVQNAGELCI